MASLRKLEIVLDVAAEISVEIAILPAKIVRGLWNKGPVDILNDLAKDDGLSKTIKATKPILDLFGSRYHPFSRSLGLTLNVLYGVAIFKEFKQHFVDPDTRFQFLKEDHPVSTVIFMVGSLIQFPYFLFYELEVVKAPAIFGRCASTLGGVPIFAHHPIKTWISRPRDISTVAGSVAHLVELIIKITKSCNKINEAVGDEKTKRDAIISEILSAKNVLKIASDFGKIGLCCLGFYYKKRWYVVMVIGTNLASVIGHSIK